MFIHHTSFIRLQPRGRGETNCAFIIQLGNPFIEKVYRWLDSQRAFADDQDIDIYLPSTNRAVCPNRYTLCNYRPYKIDGARIVKVVLLQEVGFVSSLLINERPDVICSLIILDESHLQL